MWSITWLCTAVKNYSASGIITALEYNYALYLLVFTILILRNKKYRISLLPFSAFRIPFLYTTINSKGFDLSKSKKQFSKPWHKSSRIQNPFFWCKAFDGLPCSGPKILCATVTPFLFVSEL